MGDRNNVPDDIGALRAALAAEQQARREAEARASGAEAMVAHLKLMIAKLRHDRFGASSRAFKDAIRVRDRKYARQPQVGTGEQAHLAGRTSGIPGDTLSHLHRLSRRRGAGC
jgi:hypothetical protein